MKKVIFAAINVAWTRADCLGLYPTVFGKPGEWVNSDIQFALQSMNDIKEMGDFEEGGDLKDDISMYLYTRFFVSEGKT